VREVKQIMDKRVSGKVALITGAGSGIGRAAATLFAHEGATVFAADLNFDAVQLVVREINETGAVAESVQLDVSNEMDWQRAIERIVADHERLNVLVNNAGISFAKAIDEMSLEDWRRVVAVNLDGVFLGTKWAIKAMKLGGGGSIINVASVSGIKPSPTASAYCASKAAVRMFSKATAIECADAKTGVRINVVSPGGVKTPMWQKMEFFQAMIAQHGGIDAAFASMASSPSQTFFSSDEVAETILYLASDESKHLTGTEIVLDRGHTG